MIGIECDFHTEHAIGITFAFYSRKTALQLQVDKAWRTALKEHRGAFHMVTVFW
jgi:hypothetical protein